MIFPFTHVPKLRFGLISASNPSTGVSTNQRQGGLTPRDLFTSGDSCRRVVIGPMGMPGKSFQSKLEPHFDFILEARRKRQTLQDIAQALTVRGITTTKQAVHAFIKRRFKRRYPLGVVPDKPKPAGASPTRPEKPPAEMPDLTESLPPPSEFGPDPLTRSIKKKWGIVPAT